MSKIFDVNKWQQKDQNKRCKPNAQEIATNVAMSNTLILTLTLTDVPVCPLCFKHAEMLRCVCMFFLPISETILVWNFSLKYQFFFFYYFNKFYVSFGAKSKLILKYEIKFSHF